MNKCTKCGYPNPEYRPQCFKCEAPLTMSESPSATQSGPANPPNLRPLFHLFPPAVTFMLLILVPPIGFLLLIVYLIYLLYLALGWIFKPVPPPDPEAVDKLIETVGGMFRPRRDVADQLEKIGNLYRDGILTEEEATRAKEICLGTPKTKGDEAVKRLRDLYVLHKTGALSESEFNMKKWDILSGKELR